MPRLKIFCLAHPAIWADSGIPEEYLKALLSLDESSSCWIDTGLESGNRTGIYKVGPLDKEGFGYALMAHESDIDQNFMSLEKILHDDGCLAEDVRIPIPVPRATKAVLIFDFNEGVCYVYIPGVLTPEISIIEVFNGLDKDTRIPCEEAKLFERDNEFIHEFRGIVEGRGFTPYRIEGDLETVRVTAEGDLEGNPEWKHLEESIDTDKWRTIAFVQDRSGRPFVFGVAKQRRKEFSFPSSDDYDLEQIVSVAIEVRSYIEQAIGHDIRQYLFPQTPLTEFFPE